MIEFALILPVVVLLLSGIAQYSYWFYLSNSVQAVANDAVRAAIGGLTSTERASLANAAVTTDLQQWGGVLANNASVAITDTGQNFSVKLTYNATNSPYLKLGPIPSPPALITRNAAVSLQSF